LRDKYVFCEWIASDKTKTRFYFGQLKETHQGEGRRKFSVFFTCLSKGKSMTNEASPTSFGRIYPLVAMAKEQQTSYLGKLRDSANYKHAAMHIVEGTLSLKEDLGVMVKHKMSYSCTDEYLMEVVRVRVANRFGDENFALVVGHAEKPNKLRIVWMLTREQALEYAENGQTSQASRDALGSVALEAKELLFTDWSDRINIESVIRHSSPIRVLLQVHDALEPTGSDHFCRYACQCVRGDGGKDANVHLKFDRSMTLLDVARQSVGGSFACGGDLENWICEEALCQVRSRASPHAMLCYADPYPHLFP
jgi:hypothetical protein